MNNKIVELINSLVLDNQKIVIAIEGPCTSGKTTFSEEIVQKFDCNIIHIDDFFLPFERKTTERLSEPGGNIDYERFFVEVAENLKSDAPFTYGKFSCSDGKVTEQIEMMPKPLTIVEGVYSMHPYFGDIYDYKIFLNISEETKIRRLKIRSPEKLDRFINEWIPMENKYFDEYKIKEKCDIIIDNN